MNIVYVSSAMLMLSWELACELLNVITYLPIHVYTFWVYSLETHLPLYEVKL